MRLFTHKSKWERLRDAAMSAAADRVELRGLTKMTASKVTAGAVAGAAAVTAASAAISAIRHQEDRPQEER